MSVRIHGFVFLLVAACVLAARAPQAHAQDTVELRWLSDQPPASPTGVSWGVPWPEGAVQQDAEFELHTSDGHELPVQTWLTAYWPDGSVKWSGLATVVDSGSAGPLTLSVAEVEQRPEQRDLHDVRIDVEEGSNGIRIRTGPLVAHLPVSGADLIDSLVVDGRTVAGSVHLVSIHQSGPGEDVLDPPAREERISRIDSVRIEQDGPVRAVVRYDGVHRSRDGNAEWLPFTVRLYFYVGRKPIKMVHTITYDGDQEQDFIKGLGVQFDVPMREQVHNRHVRFSGREDGLWAEPVKPLESRQRVSYQGEHVYPDQERGKPLPDVEDFTPPVQRLIDALADWNDYKLVQDSPDGFTIKKRTNPESAWVPAGAGTRASGLAFVGDVSGGLAVGLKDFWQTYPSHLEISNALDDTAQLKLWMWSPEEPAMDMRHYDAEAHGLRASYEDVQEGFSIAHGVARTHTITLFPESDVSSHAAYTVKADISQEPPLLTASPAHMHSAGVFGIWSLPDRSSPGKRWIEDKLDAAIDLYQKEIEQRRWYGFWDFGDVMHSYDAVRNTWRYDVGGYAWANSELVPDMWLWYSYLRTGREDIFRMAEAMTRHTGEVDVYHMGRFEDLGSRHNVIHWGDGAKEARISQAALRRFYYYLTTDERTGDLMEMVRDTEESYHRLDPMRLAMPADEYPTDAPARLRVGPDWLALAGNWMTAWERTGDTSYLDKIKNGFDSIHEMKYGLFSGPGVLGFEPKTGRLVNDTGRPDDHHTSHLAMIMGGAEVTFELVDLIDHEGFEEDFLRYSRLYAMPEDAPIRQPSDGEVGDGDFKSWHARLTAYAAVQLEDPQLAERAWNDLLGSPGWQRPGTRFLTRRISGPATLHPMEVSPWTSTNETAQWCLNAIEVLELIGDQMPENHPLVQRADSVQKGALLYRADMARRESVEDWRMEGPGTLRFEDGWMHMWSPGEAGHHVFWAPKTFPRRFVAEWEAQNVEPDAGLAIVFFSAKGVEGQSIFDSSLPKRDGTFRQYTQGAINAYHISYYANATHRPDRGHANLRKNKGFHLVQEGAEGIPTESRSVHKMRLVRDGPHITLYVDDREVIDWTDTGETGGPPLGSGKIGLRQMKWTHFRYRNFKVWALASSAP